MKLVCLLLVFSTLTLGEDEQTKITLRCAGVSEPEAHHLLEHYCRNFRIVANESDYTLILTKSSGDLPFSFVVLDSLDSDTVEASKRSSLASAIKDACSAMHIRFGEKP